MVNIAVLGAGVVGLSTAINIQTALPEANVYVIADKFNEETTSIGAGGIFVPTIKGVPGVQASTIKRWAQGSWHFFSKMATSDMASITGHSVSPGYLILREKIETPLYADIVFNFRELSKTEMSALGFDKTFRFGYHITTIITNMRKYMSWLMTRFKINGGHTEKLYISDLHELQGKYDVVVNCTGLGSQQLFGDKEICPLQGQVLRVQAPWIKHWVFDNNMAYILPSDDFTVLGGVNIKGNYSLDPTAEIRQGIVDRCQRAWPAIKGAKVVCDWVGLRPLRMPVRLEKETITLPTGTVKVVHNYGHGSNGVALSWGTAIEAAGLVKEILKDNFVSKL